MKTLIYPILMCFAWYGMAQVTALDLYKEAGREQEAKNFGRAIDLYSKAIQTSSHGSDIKLFAHSGKGDCYLKLGEPLKAIEEFTSAIGLEITRNEIIKESSWPETKDYLFSACYFMRYTAWYDLEEYDKACHDLERAYSLHKSDIVMELYNNLCYRRR
jgi:tetratricopeptide (TPR) repeat protein